MRKVKNKKISAKKINFKLKEIKESVEIVLNEKLMS